MCRMVFAWRNRSILANPRGTIAYKAHAIACAVVGYGGREQDGENEGCLHVFHSCGIVVSIRDILDRSAAQPN